MPRKKRPVSFSIGEVARLVGATRNQLAYWDKTGLVSPSIGGARGRGSRRLYSVEDIFELKILVKLLESSLSLQRIRSSFSFIRGQSRTLSSFVVFTDGKTVYFYEDYDTLVDTLRQGQTVLRVAVQDLIEDVQHKLTDRKQVQKERGTPDIARSSRKVHKTRKGGAE
ncbi:MAG: MerR family transcriptional regulator [Dehalococcoidia bacterium]